MTSSLITCANRTGRAVLLFGAVLSLLGLLVAVLEGWPLGDGLWWAAVTASTVGYGDLSPVTLAGRLLAALVVIPVGLVGIGVIVGRVAATVIETRDAWKHEEQEQVMHDASEAHRYAEQIHQLLLAKETTISYAINNNAGSTPADAVRRQIAAMGEAIDSVAKRPAMTKQTPAPMMAPVRTSTSTPRTGRSRRRPGEDVPDVDLGYVPYVYPGLYGGDSGANDSSDRHSSSTTHHDPTPSHSYGSDTSSSHSSSSHSYGSDSGSSGSSYSSSSDSGSSGGGGGGE